jgi:hypothetical protein
MPNVFHIYNSGNYYRLEQSLQDTNILLLYVNNEFVGQITFYEIMTYIKR